MFFYSLSFGYPGPYSNLALPPSDTSLDRGDEAAIAALDKLGLEHRHEYGWTDGSLYKYVRSSMTADQILNAVRQELTEGFVLHSVTEHLPTHNPHKGSVTSLQAYFEQA